MRHIVRIAYGHKGFVRLLSITECNGARRGLGAKMAPGWHRVGTTEGDRGDDSDRLLSL